MPAGQPAMLNRQPAMLSTQPAMLNALLRSIDPKLYGFAEIIVASHRVALSVKSPARKTSSYADIRVRTIDEN